VNTATTYRIVRISTSRFSQVETRLGNLWIICIIDRRNRP